MTVIFDGRAMAWEIEDKVRGKAAKMGRRPRLVSFFDPADAGSVAYTKIKGRKAEELGMGFEKIQSSNYTNSQIKAKIRSLNADPGVDGVMIQLPFPDSAELIGEIAPEKDVDGLRADSLFMPATVRAVMEILKLAGGEDKKIVIVGNKGEVGGRLQKILHCQGMGKDDFDPAALLGAEVIISATGQAGLITPQMVRDGVVAIDVGYPRGDFDPAVANIAAFFTPVPGGVGPVTVAMLFANLVRLTGE